MYYMNSCVHVETRGSSLNYYIYLFTWEVGHACPSANGGQKTACRSQRSHFTMWVLVTEPWPFSCLKDCCGCVSIGVWLPHLFPPTMSSLHAVQSSWPVSFWKILLSQPPLHTEVLRLHGAGKMAQGKRALAALEEDLGSIPSTLKWRLAYM